MGTTAISGTCGLTGGCGTSSGSRRPSRGQRSRSCASRARASFDVAAFMFKAIFKAIFPIYLGSSCIYLVWVGPADSPVDLADGTMGHTGLMVPLGPMSLCCSISRFLEQLAWTRDCSWLCDL